MRRGDAKIKMILSAIKGPIKGANWNIATLDDSKEAEIQKRMLEVILFEDLDKSWRGKLTEILTVFDFGYSLFEKTFKPVIDHPELGSFVGLRSLAYRSQKTIERFNVNESGKLYSVSQYAYGDAGKLVDIPAEYLVRFVLEEEGDNYEGISILRACYGPWLRKNVYLKLIAAGIEKYAIPVPILTVPDGQFANEEYEKQYNRAVNTLKAYTSHQTNYITKPSGWDLTLQPNTFDASKVREVIDAENVEMVNAALANFLELGQSGSGSYALSTDLSDFFLGALEFVADHICETINRHVIDQIISLNFKDVGRLVELRCDGISDKAGKEFAEVLTSLAREKIIIPDEKLEENVRQRYNLPKREESTERDVEPSGGGLFLAEDKKKSNRAENQGERNAKKITDYEKDLSAILAKHLIPLSKQVVEKIISNYDKSNERSQFKAIDITSIQGIPAFKKELKESLAFYTNETVDYRKNQLPRFKNVKLSETARNIRLAEVDKLNSKQRSRINATVAVLVSTMLNDIEKEAQLQYLNSVESTDSGDIIKEDMIEKVERKVSNDLVRAAAAIQATKIFNDASSDFFYTDGVFEEIESFTFVNPAPVSAICQSLNGRTFRKDSPEVDRFRPPLHHNCKSSFVPNLKSMKNNPPITKNAGIISKKAQESISLSEGPESYWPQKGICDCATLDSSESKE
jgi:hypothetical protein